MEDNDYMKLALALAQKGWGWTGPNPMVGAVIVKEGRIIGQGWHEKYGQAHGERNALNSCTETPEGGTMYVTLEPCWHYGKRGVKSNFWVSIGFGCQKVCLAAPLGIWHKRILCK